ncbi:tyrosine-type recombinase/integrase [Nonomuraea sp. M3C6]|uniref:Tyrosine-type recombinase/integrase n=1 Tax=Nonomuraea marmarensis TaxID=3351344 RepID=A0ABW7AYL1_9ACTN
MLATASSQKTRVLGLRLLLDWLADHPGQTWQERWQATGAEAAGSSWRHISAGWLRDNSGHAQWRQPALSAALVTAICADLVRPALSWLVADSTTGKGALPRNMARSRDPEGLARLRTLCEADPDASPAAGKLALWRSSLIIAAKGGMLADIAVGDVLELLDAERDGHRKITGGTAVFYRKLHAMGIFSAAVPATLQELRTAGQRTPDELIDRYQLTCRPVRDLLVDYLRERQPALDYTSLESLAHHLGNRFWADIERHHPGIDSLHLPAEVADAWKQRLRSKTTTVTTHTGDKKQVTVERISYRECLTPVRAFYLDLAHWAVEDPARWGPWVAPSPVGQEEINRRKTKRRHKSKMDARTRERLPVLPVLVAAVDRRRKDAGALLQAGEQAHPGASFTAAGQTLLRSITPHAATNKIWADDPVTGTRRDLTLEEDHAFWAFAAVEVLRATGIRIEELLELSHHSLVQYRLPTTGELVPLLQIAPSKTDEERLLLVSPELADVLSTIICRIRRPSGAVPLVPAYDTKECVWSPPAPLLFQRRIEGETRAITDGSIRTMLTAALAHTGLIDPATGGPLHYTPHDFRRLFLTDAILNGLPPHIAQVIAGHRDINVTLGYKAVYPDEAIQSHLAFLSRRRALRPSEEYRVPTDEEWQEFLGHFELRKVATGTCGRAFGTPCIHEHSCLRCPLHWPSPDQRPRIAEIRDNLIARIAEAEREGWLGEAEGLRISLAGAEDKLAQIDRRSCTSVDLGMPTITTR